MSATLQDRLRAEQEAWLGGFAVALAEVQRRLEIDTCVCEVAREAGLTLAAARAAGVSAFDLKVLRKAGVR